MDEKQPGTALIAAQSDDDRSMTPRNLTEAIELAKVLAGSTLVPKEYQNNAGNIVVAVIWGRDLGLAPMQAIQNIAVINNRPSLWGDAMLAVVQASGKLAYHHEVETAEYGECTVQRKGEAEKYSVRFTLDDAAKAGLKGKQGPWTQYTRRMMKLRARAFALRDKFSDVLRGMAITEEVIDTPAGPVERDVTTEGSTLPPEGTNGTGNGKVSRTEQLKDRLATPIPVVTVVGAFDAATNKSQIDAAVALAKTLKSTEDRLRATTAYNTAVARVKAAAAAAEAPAPTDEQLLEQIAKADTVELVALVEDSMAGLPPERLDVLLQHSAKRRQEIGAQA